MRLFARILLLVCVAGSTVGCDQAAKSAARSYLSPCEPIEAFGGVLRLILVENPGAFLGLGASFSPLVRSLVFGIFVSIALVVACVYAVQLGARSYAMIVLLALFVGGGLGNLLDRLFRSGYVTDFAQVRLGPLHTGIFNVADVAILMASLGLVIHSLSQNGRPKPQPTDQRGGAGTKKGFRATSRSAGSSG